MSRVALDIQERQRFRNRCIREGLIASREKVAAMMLRLSIATGRGDTIDDLLGELEAHIRELERRAGLA